MENARKADSRIADEANRLRSLSRDLFKREIKRLDDDTLGDLRYEFGYDSSDSRNSAWQTRDINRLLTRRKAWREARPQWIGIVISGLIGLAGLIVALLK